MNQIYQQREVLRKQLPVIYTYSLLAFISGLFLSIFDILVHARFLEVFGYKYLSSSYIIAGFVGVVLSYAYSLLFRKIHIKTLNFIISTLILASVGTYLFFSLVSPSKVNSYFGMVMLFPVNILILLPLWRFGRKLLYPRQSKEIVPGVRLVHLVGLALGGAITTASLFYYFSFSFITAFSFLLLIAYWLVQILLYKMHGNSTLFRSGKENYVPVSNSFVLFFTSRIAANLYIFALLSAIVGFSIHFTFINIAVAGFQNVIGLSKFYGLFIFVLVVFIFGVDKFLIKRILYSYDSPYSLVLIPAAIFLTLLITVSGSHFFSSTRPYEHYTMLFLLLATTKVGFESLRMIVQTPSLRTLFQALDIRYKQVVYPRIEGTVLMLGLFISGVIILAMSFLPFFTMNLVLYFIIAITILWILSGINLVRLYRKEQSEILNRLRFKKIGLISEVHYVERIWHTLTRNDEVKINKILDILALVQPLVYEKYLHQLLVHPNDQVRKLIIKKIVGEHITEQIPDLQEILNKTEGHNNEMLLEAIQNLKASLIGNKSIEQLKEIIFTGDVNERIALANSITNTADKETESILYELVKDIEAEVHEAALKSLTRFKTPDFSYVLLDFLHPEKYNPYAMAIIANSGNEAIDYLEREQLLPAATDVVLARIMKLYGRIGSERSINKILSDIANQDRTVLLQSIQALIDNQFQANNTNKYKILNLLIKQIGSLTQNLYHFQVLKKKVKLSMLAEAYRIEIDYNYNLLFKLLSLVYNPHVIASFMQIIAEGSHSQINHGIELADQFIDEDIKPVLFPLFEDISISERLKKLEYYFIQPRVNINDMLHSILTHDFNSLSLYPRACAMMYIYHNKLVSFQEELVFNAYHSEPLLCETAVFILFNLFPNSLENILNSEKYDNKLKQLIGNIDLVNEEDLFVNRFAKLKKYPAFNSFSEHVSLNLAHHARLVMLEKDKAFNISDLKGIECLVLSDNQVLKGDNNCVISYLENFLDIDLLVDYGLNQLIPDRDTEIWLFPCHIVKELLYDHIDFANIYFKLIENFSLSKN